MKRVSIRNCCVSLCIITALTCVRAEGSDVWLRKRVTWQAGTDPRVWEAVVESPNGYERLRLALVPLWCVEGGIVAIEILLASAERPDENVLGLRESDVPQPFVITVQELESGIKKSRFGAHRTFNVQRVKLKIKILGSRLGEAHCGCGNCIQDFTAEFSVQSK